ncbi:metalloregulator ArsR/SmtB family transcription factor [Aurantivibrio infirmus]
MKTKFDKDQIVKNAAEAESFLKSVANSNRLMILCSLLDGGRSVSELNEEVPLSQSALSQHLSVLRDAGLVATRRESQTIFYSLADERVSILLNTLYSIFCVDE